MQRYTVYFIWKLLYMFRVVPSPNIRSANNCIYSILYLSHRYCHLPYESNDTNRIPSGLGWVPRIRTFVRIILNSHIYRNGYTKLKIPVFITVLPSSCKISKIKTIMLPAVMTEHKTWECGFEHFPKVHSPPNISRDTKLCSSCLPTLEQHLTFWHRSFTFQF